MALLKHPEFNLRIIIKEQSFILAKHGKLVIHDRLAFVMLQVEPAAFICSVDTHVCIIRNLAYCRM